MCTVEGRGALLALDQRKVEQLREERDRLLERPPRRLDGGFGWILQKKTRYWIGFSVRSYGKITSPQHKLLHELPFH